MKTVIVAVLLTIAITLLGILAIAMVIDQIKYGGKIK